MGPGYYGDYFLTEIQLHRDHMDKQMQSVSSDPIPLGHNDCGQKIPGAFCLQPRKQYSLLQIHLPKRETNKTRLGPMGQLLARIHDCRRETENAAVGWTNPTHRIWNWCYNKEGMSYTT